MIDKRLLRMVGGDRKYIYLNVLFQWLSLAANIVMMYFLAMWVQNIHDHGFIARELTLTLCVAAAALLARFLCTRTSSRMSFLSSRGVKKTFRAKIFQKLFRLGPSYMEQTAGSAELVQLSVEGVDQLEVYFGAYIPQFFYAMIAPLTLFVVLSFQDWFTALMLFLTVWLIPVIIMGVQTWAKKLLSSYLNRYYKMGDSFLENLQGMTTLKIYQADGRKSEEMDDQAEKFRKITMKVLTMQLNSIAIMDFVTYAGGALGVLLSVLRLRSGVLDLSGALWIILLSIDFFLPMRRLGSYFHVAMNGMTASKKMFKLLDLPEPEEGQKSFGSKGALSLSDVHFSYQEGQEVLHGVSMDFPDCSFTGLAGESGCGKSTVAALLMGRNRGYTGEVMANGVPLSQIQSESLLRSVCYIGSDSFLFQGTVRDNLLMGKPDASDKELWDALAKVKLDGFLREEQGLDTRLQEQASNFSGGQKQRLALARALLLDSRVYIFDEATSNIDADSEEQILDTVRDMVGQKTILFISHRLANLVGTDRIYCMERGEVTEQGSHEELLQKNGTYAKLWQTQYQLEHFTKEANA